MIVLPVSTVTPEQLMERLNIKAQPEAARVLSVAVESLDLELRSAIREVPVELYDDWILRVAGAIVGSGKRPTGATPGQFTSTEQTAPGPVPSRDYLWTVRGQLANYVPFGFA